MQPSKATVKVIGLNLLRNLQSNCAIFDPTNCYFHVGDSSHVIIGRTSQFDWNSDREVALIFDHSCIRNPLPSASVTIGLRIYYITTPFQRLFTEWVDLIKWKKFSSEARKQNGWNARNSRLEPRQLLTI